MNAQERRQAVNLFREMLGEAPIEERLEVLLKEAQSMAEAAALVLDRWEEGDLASAVVGLAEALDSLRRVTEQTQGS